MKPNDMQLKAVIDLATYCDISKLQEMLAKIAIAYPDNKEELFFLNNFLDSITKDFSQTALDTV